jgi:hypothetical protein
MRGFGVPTTGRGGQLRDTVLGGSRLLSTGNANLINREKLAERFPSCGLNVRVLMSTGVLRAREHSMIIPHSSLWPRSSDPMPLRSASLPGPLISILHVHCEEYIMSEVDANKA